jgi:hypothetical protein
MRVQEIKFHAVLRDVVDLGCCAIDFADRERIGLVGKRVEFDGSALRKRG